MAKDHSFLGKCKMILLLTLLMTMLCTELGEHAPLEVGEEDDEDIAERAQLAREAQMICDAIKDDVWLDPISLYEAARIAGEE